MCGLQSPSAPHVSHINPWAHANQKRTGKGILGQAVLPRQVGVLPSRHNHPTQTLAPSTISTGLSRSLVVKNLPANIGDRKDAGLIPGSGRSHGGGHGNPPQCSCLENPMDRGAWWATVHGVSESDTAEAT